MQKPYHYVYQIILASENMVIFHKTFICINILLDWQKACLGFP